MRGRGWSGGISGGGLVGLIVSRWVEEWDVGGIWGVEMVEGEGGKSEGLIVSELLILLKGSSGAAFGYRRVVCRRCCDMI